MQTPSYRFINNQKHCSFVIKDEPFDLNTTWHYHEEIEIMCFFYGNVSGIMGKKYCDFSAGELILLGSNFPHVIFESKQSTRKQVTPCGMVLQFKRNFLGDTFFEAPELNKINKLLDRSKNGLRFKKTSLSRCMRLLKKISKRTSTHQLFDLLEVLNLLSEIPQYELLSMEESFSPSENGEKRMDVIRNYLNAHFKEDISVKEIASLVNMTVTSFCRYYKNHTLKHFKQTLNEMRISFACERLNQGRTIQEACYESGFNNPAYFSRTFKRIVGINPSAYKTYSDLKIVRW